MDFSKLTDYQVYEISQDLGISVDIRTSADNELIKRKLSYEQVRDIVLQHESQFKAEKQSDLMWEFKILLVIFPFFIPRRISLTSKWLASGQKRKWKSFWFYVCLGYLLWTVIAILIARFFFKR
ncbi:MAG: hypothetical protein QM764_13790 [Chitinophagaceae bacterium]